MQYSVAAGGRCNREYCSFNVTVALSHPCKAYIGSTGYGNAGMRRTGGETAA